MGKKYKKNYFKHKCQVKEIDFYEKKKKSQAPVRVL